MTYEETKTFKHSPEVREAMRLLKAESKARKKVKTQTEFQKLEERVTYLENKVNNIIRQVTSSTTKGES